MGSLATFDFIVIEIVSVVISTRFQYCLEIAAERLNYVRDLEDHYILKQATVIGMTTTGKADL